MKRTMLCLLSISFILFSVHCEPIKDLRSRSGETRSMVPVSSKTIITPAPVCDGSLVVPLIAGRTLDGGTVTVWNDADTLSVSFNSTGTIKEIHLSVETAVELIPQNKPGNPIPGHFTYKKTYTEPTTSDTFSISLAERGFEQGLQLAIAAHAVVDLPDDNGCESAWAAGLDFPGKNWATYFQYTLCEPYEPAYKLYYNSELQLSFDLPVEVTDKDIIEFYSYNDPTSLSYNGDLVPAESNIAQVFLISDMNGDQYLTLVLDIPGDSDGGTAEIAITSTGLENSGLSFVIKDEPTGDQYQWDDVTGTGSVSFEWFSCCTDGFVLGPVPANQDFSITLEFTSVTGIDAVKYHYTGSTGDVEYSEPMNPLGTVTIEYSQQ